MWFLFFLESHPQNKTILQEYPMPLDESDLHNLVFTTVSRLGDDISPDLILAICKTESSLHPYAWNPEPKYRYVWNVKTKKPFRNLTYEELSSNTPPKDFPTLAGDRDQEWWGQRASWGLMQVMGAVAREHGYEEPYLTSLVDPGNNVRIGCLHLHRLYHSFYHEHGINGVIAAYNAGSPRYKAGVLENAAYVTKVRKNLPEGFRL
jgi:hypothetical protein